MKKAVIFISLFIIGLLFPLDIIIPIKGLVSISILTFILGILFMSLIRKGSLIYQSYKSRGERFTFNFVTYLAIASLGFGMGLFTTTFISINEINLLSPILILFGIGLYIGIKLEFYFNHPIKV